MQALQRKYANDKETLNIKMAELYKEEKFNPMGGCLPMLIQMPIIMGLVCFTAKSDEVHRQTTA